jgi:hypothetical protein
MLQSAWIIRMGGALAGWAFFFFSLHFDIDHKDKRHFKTSTIIL